MLSLLFVSPEIHLKEQLLEFAGVRKVPEDFRKLVRKHTLFFLFPRSSGSFRKLSGSLSGSLFNLLLYSRSSGRCWKVPGSLSGSLFEDANFPQSGSFRKNSGRPNGRVSTCQVLLRGTVSGTSCSEMVASNVIPTYGCRC